LTTQHSQKDTPMACAIAARASGPPAASESDSAPGTESGTNTATHSTPQNRFVTIEKDSATLRIIHSRCSAYQRRRAIR
jgi:hypothetical protein